MGFADVNAITPRGWCHGPIRPHKWTIIFEDYISVAGLVGAYPPIAVKTWPWWVKSETYSPVQQVNLNSE